MKNFVPTPENLAECRDLLAQLETGTKKLVDTIDLQQKELESAGQHFQLPELLKASAQLATLTETARRTIDGLDPAPVSSAQPPPSEGHP
jgi:hypothetical protein